VGSEMCIRDSYYLVHLTFVDKGNDPWRVFGAYVDEWRLDRKAQPA
jgi:hypothetical protein